LSSNPIRYDENFHDFIKLVESLLAKETEFVVATVVSVRGSAVAKVGAKGIILPDGRVLGWLGGWCSENAIVFAALDTLKRGSPRLLKLVMSGSELRQVSEDIIEVGTPCGGEVLLYVEPVYPKPQVIIFGNNRVSKALARLASIVGFKVAVVDSTASREEYPEAEVVVNSLSEASKLRYDRHTYAVVATMGRTELDVEIINFLLDKNLERVFLIASVNRAEEVLRTLLRKGRRLEELEKVIAPSGIDIGAITPEELALSVIAGIVAYRRGGSGEFLTKVKGNPLRKLARTESRVEQEEVRTLATLT
jgi:xanthine dehydrogenase accessory factor